MAAQRLDFDDFLGPFGHLFFIKFRNHPNLLNCNKHNVKTQLLQFQASYFGIENKLEIHSSSRHALGSIFISCYSLYVKIIDFWTPFKIKLASIGDPNLTICAQLLQVSYVPLLQAASLEPTGDPEATNAPQGLIFNGF